MNEHTRRSSLRLQRHDYSQTGLYFITICAKNGEMMFGEIVGGNFGAVGAAAHIYSHV